MTESNPASNLTANVNAGLSHGPRPETTHLP